MENQFIKKFENIDQDRINNLEKEFELNKSKYENLVLEEQDKVHKLAMKLNNKKENIVNKAQTKINKLNMQINKLDVAYLSQKISDEEFKKRKQEFLNKIRETRSYFKNLYISKNKLFDDQLLEFTKKQRSKVETLKKELEDHNLKKSNDLKKQIHQIKKQNENQLSKLKTGFDKLANELTVKENQINNDYKKEINYVNSISKNVVSDENKKIKILELQNKKEKQIKKLNTIYNIKNEALIFKKRISNYFANLFSINNLINFDKKIKTWILNNKLIFVIIIFAIIVGAIHPLFFSSQNWLNNILNQNIAVGLLAIGMTFIILTGGIDLSVGSAIGFSAGLMLYLNQVVGINLGGSIVIGFLLAISIGLFNGFLSSYGKLQSFIVTLVGLLVFRGLLNVMLGGSPVSISNNDTISFLNTGTIGVLPSALFIFIFITIFLIFILKFTRFGRYIYATGSNKNAAKASGIKTKWIITSAFVIGGILVGLASVAYIGNVQSVEPQTGNGFELSAIAAVVLGGTSLTGGKGTITKTIIGWLLISVLNNALVFLNVDSNLQLVFRGIIILVAVLLDKNFDFKTKVKRVVMKLSRV
ncbi:hypothetical protein ACA758_00140 [Mycoplasmopsis agassizii]|uniref:ABC transporter permease subunit n=1 Tax=Mycoplasmopsis agassizii TaxID=33922 RepID=UPI0035297C5B